MMAYGAASIISLVLAMVLSSWLFLTASVIGFTVILLSLAFLPRRPEVERSLERERVFEGDEVETRIDLKSGGHGGNIEIYDPLSPALRIAKGSNHALVPPGDRRLTYSVEAPLRGNQWVGPLKVRRWDPLWLWHRESESGGREELTVFPKIYPSSRGELMLKRPKPRPGAMHLRKIGSGKEFHSIRDYTPTDPFNTINWKAYARTGKLLVNQYEAESVTDIVFILDARMVSRAGKLVDNPLERSIRLCASMSKILLRGSNRVGIIIYGSTVSVFKPEGGSTGFNNILHQLAQVEPSGYSTLASAVSYSMSYIPPEAPVVVLSPMSLDPSFRQGIRALVARGHPVQVVSPSGLEFEKEVSGNVVSPRYLLKHLSRQNLIRELRDMGVRVVDWNPDRDVGSVTREVWS